MLKDIHTATHPAKHRKINKSNELAKYDELLATLESELEEDSVG